MTVRPGREAMTFKLRVIMCGTGPTRPSPSHTGMIIIQAWGCQIMRPERTALTFCVTDAGTIDGARIRVLTFVKRVFIRNAINESDPYMYTTPYVQFEYYWFDYLYPTFFVRHYQ